uniref:Uncharacterized protein n=1 Tax=Anopheles dirus TaxID=7168 RepID=A0A182NX40_9DIPT
MVRGSTRLAQKPAVPVEGRADIQSRSGRSYWYAKRRAKTNRSVRAGVGQHPIVRIVRDATHRLTPLSSKRLVVES